MGNHEAGRQMVAVAHASQVNTISSGVAISVLVFLALLCSSRSMGQSPGKSSDRSSKILNLVESLEGVRIREIVECDFGFNDNELPLVVVTDDQILLFYRYISGKYQPVLSYRDKFGYACSYTYVNPLLRTKEGDALVTQWNKFGDDAFVIFARRGNQIVQIFAKFGGQFTAEFADVNHDDLTDILVSDDPPGKTNLVHTRMTEIYIQQRSSTERKFTFFKRSLWKGRFRALSSSSRTPHHGR